MANSSLEHSVVGGSSCGSLAGSQLWPGYVKDSLSSLDCLTSVKGYSATALKSSPFFVRDDNELCVTGTWENCFPQS